ncbi:beta-lactamase domain protein [Paraburkholderia xenovorans LB400]|nr:beta-lactamase domain protein [Paraburkholderia xenovorans LB400]
MPAAADAMRRHIEETYHWRCEVPIYLDAVELPAWWAMWAGIRVSPSRMQPPHTACLRASLQASSPADKSHRGPFNAE